MRITVGQVLLVVGAGTYAVLGPLKGGEKLGLMTDQLRDFAAKNIPYMERFKRETPPPPVPIPEPETNSLPPQDLSVQDRLPAGEEPPVGQMNEFSEVPLTPLPVAEAEKPAPPPPVVEKPPEPAKPAAPVVRRKRRVARPSTAARATAKPAAPKTARTPKKSGDALVGTYVALKLKTGNTVKGVLVERTASNYKIELPGMGAFDYPAATVLSVAAAE